MACTNLSGVSRAKKFAEVLRKLGNSPFDADCYLHVFALFWLRSCLCLHHASWTVGLVSNLMTFDEVWNSAMSLKFLCPWNACCYRLDQCCTKGCRPKLSMPRWIIQLVMGSKRCHGMKFWRCCPGLEISWYDMIHDMIHDISTTFKDDLRRLGRH